ncbi:unnamed protein product [Bursaphelenchus xylophilus]|uniref:(pine wood nematode) hypothetical protein n=1 Tax=Bursaphelenchus xylophilus TaxID=6326 RepID=A0A1I7RWV2_BURXY|nr:unnamed protein product [Bursaphelenchus xylophilus]CAG9128728.1 unnamed protein product [Bursaphelenchus xylophilus]
MSISEGSPRRRLFSTGGIGDAIDYVSNASGRSSDGFHCHELTSEQVETKKRAIRVLWASVVVCMLFMICEIVGGWWAASLAIITDAAHLLTDLASMLISLFSLYLASRPASQRMSFGWHRAEVVGAFVSVFMIWVVTGILVYLAIERIISAKYEIDGEIMAITAAIGVGVNIIMGLLLYCGGHGHSHLGGGHNHSHPPTERTSLLRSASGTSNGYAPIEEDAEHNSDEKRGPEVNINVRAAFVHVLGDLLQSCGVLVAALIILWKPQWGIVDPICTLIFSVIVMCTTFYIIRDALVVLLEGRPSSIDFSIVFKSLESIEGVKKVHNLRIWALTMNKIALSVHLEIDPDTDAQAVLKATSLMLKQKFGVHESTIQIEDFQADSAECNECQPPVA